MFNKEKNKEYTIRRYEIGYKVNIDVFENSNKKSVKLDLSKLQGSDSDALSAYIQYVLNPTMEGEDKTVVLDNNNWKLTFLPDMIFTLEDKETNKILEGRNGFQMDFAIKDGKVYLLVVDPKTMTKEQFLNDSDYVNTSRIILVPISCDSEKVTYKVIKPEDMANQELDFYFTGDIY